MSLSFHSTPLGRLQAQLDRPLRSTSLRFSGADDNAPKTDPPQTPDAPQPEKPATVSDIFGDIGQFGSKVFKNTIGQALSLGARLNPFGQKATPSAEEKPPAADDCSCEAPEASQPAPPSDATPETASQPPSPDSSTPQAPGGWFSGVTGAVGGAATAIGQTVGDAVMNPVTTAKKVGTAVNDTVVTPTVERAQAGWNNSKDQLGEDLKALPGAIPTIILSAPVKPLLPLAIGNHFKETIIKAAQGAWDPKSVKAAPAPGEEAPESKEPPEKP